MTAMQYDVSIDPLAQPDEEWVLKVAAQWSGAPKGANGQWVQHKPVDTITVRATGHPQPGAVEHGEYELFYRLGRGVNRQQVEALVDALTSSGLLPQAFVAAAEPGIYCGAKRSEHGYAAVDDAVADLIRPATAAEHAQSLAAGPTGAFDLTTRVLEVLADAGGNWVGPDRLIAVAERQPVTGYRHELDDADGGETGAFGDDATGAATEEVRPDRKGLADALAELESAGRIESAGAAFDGIHAAYRIGVESATEWRSDEH